MKLFRPICNAAAAGFLTIAVALPSISFAHDQEHHGGQHGQASPEERAQWMKKHLDKEAAMLEIKASQESAWGAYSAAALDLMNTFGDRKTQAAKADAATTMRQRAEKASAMAQNLSKLADATEKLQSVLNEDQRKVLDRMVRMHFQFHHRHHHGGWQGHDQGRYGSVKAPDASKSSPKVAAPAKAKN